MDINDRQLILDAEVAVFDFDGTLARFDLDWVALKAELTNLADSFGHPDRFLTTFHPDLAELRIAGGEELFVALCTRIGEWEAAGFRSDTVDRDLVDMMAQRHAADERTAIFSANSGQGIRQVLGHNVWQGITPFVVGREDVVKGKPDAEGLHTIAAHFGVNASELVFVGDAPDDFAAAAAAGAHMIQVPKIPLPSS